ncbi:hypothetical protein MPH_13334, partial [Macrophomina phaseolina MS6]
ITITTRWDGTGNRDCAYQASARHVCHRVDAVGFEACLDAAFPCASSAAAPSSFVNQDRCCGCLFEVRSCLNAPGYDPSGSQTWKPTATTIEPGCHVWERNSGWYQCLGALSV